MSLAIQIPPRRILVRGVNWLGDAVMTTPALLRLREKFPAAHIALLVPAKLADLWKFHPAVNEVIPFSANEGIWSISRKLRYGSELEILRGTEEKFHAGPVKFPPRYDLALVLPNSPRAALEVFLAGIPQRIGYSRPWRNFFLTRTIADRTGAVKMRKRTEAEIRELTSENSKRKTHKLKLSTTAHQLHEYLHLVAALGANPEPLAPQLMVTPEEVTAARNKFGMENISAPIFGLNPGAEYGPAKRWPVEKFITTDGYKFLLPNHEWVAFRASGTEPLIRCYIEAKSPAGLKKLQQACRALLAA